MENDILTSMLTKGHAKQWALAYAESLFAQAFPSVKSEGILSEQDAKVLRNNFRTEAQIDVLNRYASLTNRIIPYCRYINELFTKFIAEYYNASMYILLIDTYRKEEERLNDILKMVKDANPKSNTLYNKILKRIIKEERILAAIEPADAEGKIVSFNYTISKRHDGPDEEPTFEYNSPLFMYLATSANSIANAYSKALAAIEAILLVMKEEKMNLKIVKAFISQNEDKFYNEYHRFQPTYNQIVKDVSIPAQEALNSRNYATEGLAYIPSAVDIEADPDEIQEIVREIKGGAQ